MATRKITLSLDAAAVEFAERAAREHGISLSSWLSRAARREAVRTGYHPPKRVADAQRQAAGDEAELATAEKELRAEG